MTQPGIRLHRYNYLLLQGKTLLAPLVVRSLPGFLHPVKMDNYPAALFLLLGQLAEFLRLLSLPFSLAFSTSAP